MLLLQRLIYSLVACLLVPSPGFAQVGSEDGRIVAWIQDRAIPLAYLEAGNGFQDLEPLRQVLGDVRIVGLGEATHGTREFLQFKHRMVEFLVGELGFTIFGIESSHAECVAINDYVMYGEGDASEALASQGFWTWDTEEVLELIEWMREHNSKAPGDRKVSFVGFDFQKQGRAIEVMEAYSKIAAPRWHRRLRASLARLDTVLEESRSLREPRTGKLRPIAEAIYGFVGYLDVNRSRLIRRTSERAFTSCLEHARVLAQFVEAEAARSMPHGHEDSASSLRDEFMANNIKRYLTAQPEGARMIIWGHNLHVSHTAFGNTKFMGEHLQNAYGPDYYALGFLFYEGSFQARETGQSKASPLREFSVGPAPKGSIEWYFARTGIKNFALDIRKTSRFDEIEGWLEGYHPSRNIGAVYSDAHDVGLPQLSLGASFDGVIFIRQTTRARPTPTGRRGETGEDGLHMVRPN